MDTFVIKFDPPLHLLLMTLPKVDAAQTQELESTPEVHRPCLCSLDHANHRMTHQWQVVILCKLRLLT